MHRSVLEAEMDILWQRYGVEYRIVGSAVHPSEMPLLVEPVADHRFVKRSPCSFASDGETEETGETQRALADFSSLTELDCSLFDQSSASVPVSRGQEPGDLSVAADDLGKCGEGSANSSTVTPDTVFKCFTSALRPQR